MRRKILSITILFVLLIGLVGCIKRVPNGSYTPETEYEIKLIETVSQLEGSVVPIVDANHSNPTTSLGSAIVIKQTRNNHDYTYHAITSAELFDNANDLVAYINNGNYYLESYAINETYGIAVITFTTRINLKVAKYDLNGFYYPIVGQTIVTHGTDSNLSYPFVSKEGIVTNESINYRGLNAYFSHDAATNAGEIGGGVFNLDGYLIGFNVNRIFKNENYSSEENINSLNYALKLSAISNLFANLNNIDYSSHHISNNYMTPSNNNKTYSLNEYEAAVHSQYEHSESVVAITGDDYYASGIIIKKDNNQYSVLTANVDDKTNIKVKKDGQTYNAVATENLNSYLSLVTFFSTTFYQPYHLSNVISNRVSGQTVVVIGSSLGNVEAIMNKGLLSKVDSEYDHLFMHSAKANYPQIGSPIFNLVGDLLGIHVGKINVANDEGLAAEGLAYGYMIEDVLHKITDFEDVEYEDYVSNSQFENRIMKVSRDTINKTVTVKTSTGHGSGVIFHKSKSKNGVYTYSVMTNHHVVSEKNESGNYVVNNEISIVFNNGHPSVRAVDYYLNNRIDMAIVRFESIENLDISLSKAINEIEKVEFVPGQIVVALGTPSDKNRTGYVTMGILSRKVMPYQAQSDLGLVHTAPLNPGNSGGPLFNLSGELMAINVAKGVRFPSLSGYQFSEGIGISLNINKISEVYNSVILPVTYNKMPDRSPRIGITVVQLEGFLESILDPLDKIGDVTYGIVIIDVDELYDVFGKVFIYDVIIAINGNMITKNDDVVPYINGKPFGTELTLTIVRKGLASPINVVVKLS